MHGLQQIWMALIISTLEKINNSFLLYFVEENQFNVYYHRAPICLKINNQQVVESLPSFAEMTSLSTMIVFDVYINYWCP